MSDGHLAEVQAELEIEKRTRDEVMVSTWEIDLQNFFVQKNDLITSYEVPKIMDYVMQNDKSQRAEIGIKEWTRKLQIAQQENLMLKKKFSRLN